MELHEIFAHYSKMMTFEQLFVRDIAISGLKFMHFLLSFIFSSISINFIVAYIINFNPEDILHDVFVSFAEGISDFELTGSLKGYLARCVANCAKDARRARKREGALLGTIKTNPSGPPTPEDALAADEESRLLTNALNNLAPEQRDVIVLHLRGEMKLSEIGDLQGVSVNTVKSRYRYGLEKLRSILNGQVEK